MAEAIAKPGMVDDFKAKVAKFVTTFDFLESKRWMVARHPKIKADYDALQKKGVWIKSVIEKATGGADTVKGWWTSVFGEASGLGLLPLIPVAVIAASSAMIAKWMSDAFMMAKKLNAIEKLEARGVPPAEASAIVERLSPSALLDFRLGGLSITTIVVMGAALFLLLKARKW